MKKLFLLLTLIATTIGAWGATTGWTTVSKASSKIASEQSVSNNQDKKPCPFDDAITFDHFKYYDTNQFRLYFQNNWSGSKFTMTAKTGVIIHSVKFTYSADANTILSDAFYWGGDGKTVPTEHRIISGTTYVIDATSKTFWVGITSGTSGSNVNITNIEITYIYLPSPELKFAETSKTVCKNAAAFVNPLQNKGNGKVEYSSNKTSVATVNKDNGTITIKGAGSATITASVPATTRYLADNTSFTLEVTNNLTPSPVTPVDITENKQTLDLTQDNSWTGLVSRYTINYNNALTFTTVANSWNAKTVNTANDALRYYQSNNQGTYIVTAKAKAVIKSAKFTYDSQNNGTMTKYYGSNGENVPSEYRIVSGSTTYTANANTFTLYAGSNASGKTDGRADIRTFSIVYTDPTIVFERLQGYSSGTANVDGDNKLYKWTVNAQNHTEDVGAYKGIKIQDGNSIAMRENPEGGIKSVSFDYKVLSTSAIGLNVSAGSTTHNFTHNAADASGRIFTYTHDFSKEENSALTIAMVSGKSAIAVGPIHITPYLLFNVANHAATFNIEQGTKCDLNSALINNTGATPTFTVEENTAGGNPSITDGILDFSSVVRTGTIKVQAAWGSVTTTLTLTINLKNPEISFGKTTDTKMITDVTYKQGLTSELSSGAVTYSLFSAPDDKATIDADGTVHFSTAGEYVVKGMVAAALPYAEDTASYTLTVTELIVPTLSFTADNIEKPVGAAGFINTFTKPEDHTGAVTYSSSETGVATVEENGDGTVTIVGAGTTTITASVAETSIYAAGNKSYSLKVFPLSDISFADEEKNVYLNADPFTYAVIKTAGDGAITYSSSDTNIAGVDNNGLVTLTHTASGPVTITAIIAKTENYWADTATYTLNVSSLKLPTASFTDGTINKVQGFEAFTNTSLTTTSDGVKTYESSDTRVATVNETTGEVTKGEKPGQTVITVKIAASATWEKVEASYTLNVSSAPIADMKKVVGNVPTLATTYGWVSGDKDENCYLSFDLDDVISITSAKGNAKYLKNTGDNLLRYYQNTNKGEFTIQAKAGVIIQSIKLNYGYTGVVTNVWTNNGCSVPDANQVKNGIPFKVDANAITLYTGSTDATSGKQVRITDFEVTYFDPSTGVAVTKSAFDMGKNQSLADNTCYQDVAINNAITLHADANNTMRYSKYGYFNCYRWCGPIDIKAREGATIHHVKITYTTTDNAVLSKYATGLNIPAIDQIASDSIIYVNANSLRLNVGSSANTGGTLSIKKIYVNYTDGDEVVVDNFNNCTPKSGDSVVVAGVDGKYDWTIKKFARDNAQRMYYDQSIKLNAGGKIYTEYTGGLKEAAFDWHPTESGKDVSFTVNAGDSSWTVSKTAAVMDKVYTFNFQKTVLKSNGEFSIVVDNASDKSAIEIGHISLTPYILYTTKVVTIAAKDYKDAGYKYTNSSLINYTGKTIEYSTSDASIASIDATTGEVTIQTGGTVTISATADGATTSYSLTINLEETSAEFTTKAPEMLLKDKTYTQTLSITTEATEGNQITYSISGNPADGATINSTTGKVDFTKVGVYTITGTLAQNMPYAAAEDYYTLTVTGNPVPHISYAVTDTTREITDGKFTNPLWTPGEGVGDTTYVSTDPTVATVDDFGEVTPLKVGETTIKAYVAEGSQYAADSAKYVLTVFALPKPVMHFTESSVIAYLNTEPFTNALIVEEGDGEISYKSDDVLVATVDNTGKVVVTGHGETTIKAISTKTANYQADSVTFTLTVKKQLLPAAWFTDTEVQKYLSAGTYTNVLNQNPISDGAVSYESSNPSVASVTNAGVVTLKKNGSVTITATIAATTTYETANASYELTVLADPIEDIGTVTGNVPHYADSLHWQSGDAAANCYRYFYVGKASVSSVAGNAMYKKESDEKKYLRYYQSSSKGQFTIRVPEGGIIQSVKFKYTAQNGGVLTTDYGTNGQSITEAKQIKNNTTYKFDANFVNFYTGNTGAAANGEVRITDFVIKYFVPSTGVTVTKQMIDLKKQYGYETDSSYLSVPLNNVISMNVTQNGTQKYLDNGNQFRYYQGNGPVTFQAREGTKIHYLKITYTTSGNATSTLNKYAASSSVAPTDQIPSDSILYVNDQSITLYVGTTDGKTGGQVRISKVYVVYTDATASVETFKSAPLSGTTPVVVESADGVYKWQLTQYARDSTHRLYYVYTTMIRKGGKIETVGTEGGVKEVAFDWFASNSEARAQFNVKVGDSLISAIDSAKAGGWYPISYAKTGIKKNGAFSIEVPSTSGSQVEIPHISLTPYLLYTEKEVDATVGVPVKNTDLINNTDGEGTITYSFSGAGTVGEDGTITPAVPGNYTVTATWGDVSTTYTLNVTGEITLYDNVDNSTTIASMEGQTIDVTINRAFQANTYNTICLPFNTDKAALATALGREITSLAKYNQSATLDGEKKNLDVEIKEVEDDEDMPAGTPYLLQFSGENITDGISFSDVEIVNTTGLEVGQGGTTQFIGTINPYTVSASAKSVLFVVAGNKLAWNATGVDKPMKGFRAYFNVPGMTDQSGVAPRLVFRQPQTPTGIDNLNDNDNIRKMIINNQLIIIRNGVRYNANGQLLKMAK